MVYIFFDIVFMLISGLLSPGSISASLALSVSWLNGSIVFADALSVVLLGPIVIYFQVCVTHFYFIKYFSCLPILIFY